MVGIALELTGTKDPLLGGAGKNSGALIADDMAVLARDDPAGSTTYVGLFSFCTRSVLARLMSLPRTVLHLGFVAAHASLMWLVAGLAKSL